MLHFLQIERKTSHQQKDYDSHYFNTCFIVTLAFLWWSGIEPTIASRYVSMLKKIEPNKTSRNKTTIPEKITELEDTAK